ncbi:maleylpyruvate isomerase family mycothiol-dependent enzyme [Streptomyces afghaniensis]|uniref:maleylpyruvate isomerase family mycothiol-dependent enzyme n=1 Tax=Streptomyces afghaniensis TaxID=66865 RepID=UPI00277D95F5|nr:maleylpyruvate isomerase family mycothiol-dependent enzyme [Streptomyces afghaniensis]MDQ1021955.1 maleylpyruvate isomerase [Streptomyces afghaniensis]
MRPPVTEVIGVHAVPARLVAPLDDEQVRAASALPGWSRGHVLAHLNDNARMFTRLAEHALRGELVPAIRGRHRERNAIIEVGAGRSADGHRAELAARSAELEAVWGCFTEADWGRPVTFRAADVSATVHARWREAWIHMVDLDLGVRPRDWPEEPARHAIDFLLCRLPAGTRVRAEDLRREWVRDDRPGPVVTGRLRDLAAWMAGRVPAALPVAAEGLPVLGPWPPHPPQSRG